MTFKDPDNKLSGALRVLLTQLRWEMQYLHRQVEESDKLIVRIAGELEACKLSSAFATTPVLLLDLSFKQSRSPSMAVRPCQLYLDWIPATNAWKSFRPCSGSRSGSVSRFARSRKP